MSTSNMAVWLDGKGEKLRLGPAALVKPGKGEVLVKVHAVAINPADWIVQDTGLFIQHWPHGLGEDAAGEIVELGEDVKDLSVGQRVTAGTLGPASGRDECCAFANHVVTRGIVTCPIPDDMSYEKASVFPLATWTAGAGLFSLTQLALPLPSTRPQKHNKSVILWGGSTSVGCMGIQLATASGVTVIATASPRNFDLCKGLGAVEVFDYNSDTVKDDILNAVRGTQCVGAYNATPSEEAQMVLGKIMHELGGGLVVSAGVVTAETMSYPPGVKGAVANSRVLSGEDEKLSKAIWKAFMPQALASGQVKSAPETQVVGTGLEYIQAAFDEHRKGVSGKKIVVSI